MQATAQTATTGTVFWSFIVGLSSASLPLILLWVKLRLDQLSARCDAFAKQIEDLAEKSLEYWLLGVVSTDDPLPAHDSDKARDRLAAYLKHEVRLRGSQALLQSDVERMGSDLPSAQRIALKAELVPFVDALTGGQFGDRDGYSAPHKARATITSAAKIVRIVRQGRDDISKPHNIVRFIFGLL